MQSSTAVLSIHQKVRGAFDLSSLVVCPWRRVQLWYCQWPSGIILLGYFLIRNFKLNFYLDCCHHFVCYSMSLVLFCGCSHLNLFLCVCLLNPVQHECIPQAILGMDILCQAKSGMGKTAVFVLATLQQIEPVDGQVSAYVHNKVYLSQHSELLYRLQQELTHPLAECQKRALVSIQLLNYFRKCFYFLT